LLELAEQKQYVADLKQRMQMVEARNRVLIDLVNGMSGEPPLKAAPNADQGRTSLEMIDRDLQALVASVLHSREDIATLQAQRKALTEELAQAKRAIEASHTEEERTAARVSAFRDLLTRLSPLIEKGELAVRVVRSRMVLQLPETTLFESDGADLTANGKRVLDRVADALLTIRARNFQVGGHTDSGALHKGRFVNSWQLSSVRALNVMLYLIDRGVPKARLSAAAYADTEPIADDATTEGRTQNRRLEIVLLPNLDELPNLAALSELLQNPSESAR
jgi:chemotaxis protein MotB